MGIGNPVFIYLVEVIKSISTVTNKDYIDICSTFITLTEPKYRCSDCKFKYKSKFTEHQDHMACNYYAAKYRHQYLPEHNNVTNPKILYKKCIGNYFNGFWASIINYFPRYKDGVLPFPGSYFEQPSKFVESMDLIHNLIRENEIKREKQAQEYGKRSSKR